MSKRHGHKYVSQGAITPQRMKELLHPPAPGSKSPDQIRREQDVQAAHDAKVAEAARRWGVSDGSADAIVKNPWVESWLQKIKGLPGAGAYVSQVSHFGSSPLVELKIKSSRDKHDVTAITVSQDGGFEVSRWKEAKNELLRNVVESIRPPDASNPALNRPKTHNYDF